MNKAFSTHVDKEIDHDGFHMTFANGCTISVMFGNLVTVIKVKQQPK